MRPKSRQRNKLSDFKVGPAVPDTEYARHRIRKVRACPDTGYQAIATALIYALLVLSAVIATLVRPAAALAPILCTFGIEQWAQANSAFFTTHVALTNVTTGLILVLALTLSFVRGRPFWSGYPAVGWVTFALLGLAVLSIFWSVYRAGSIDQWKSHFPYIFTIVILTPLLIHEPRDLQTGFMATLVFGFVILLLLLVSTERGAIGRGIALQTTSSSIAKQAGNPLEVASLAGYTAILAVLMNFRGAARFWQAARWLIFGIAVWLSFRSGSRGQLIATFLVVVAFVPVSRKIRSLKGFFGSILALAVAGAFAMWVINQAGASQRWQWDAMVENYEDTRLEYITELLSHWASASPVNWLLGLGSSASYAPHILGHYPHIVPVEILAEEGLLGLAIWLLIVALSARSIRRAFRIVSDDPEARGLVAALGAMFCFSLLLTFKQGSLLGSTHFLAFAIMLGRFEVALRKAAVQWEHQPITSHSPAYAATPA